ncbi:MAG: family 10 glycosylhydrolase [Dactylosporangium sp.]|nr:family 10 glycosylhydrolase [Dactylosporangium sp.]NNJ63276.1 family 10 glycosylhydrolase [Dactylosporangium sp.]
MRSPAGGKRVVLRSVRGLVDNRPLLTTVSLVVLAIALALGSLVGVLLAAEHAPEPPVSVSVDPAGCPTDPARPKRQFRAMWITTVVNIDWPSRQGLDQATVKAEYLDWLEVARRNRFNAVIVMVRVAGDTFWPSPHEPWSQYLTGVRGQDPGWDPLAFAVAEAHKRDLEFHAWFNPYRASLQAPGGAGTDLNQLAEGHPLRAHPEWAVAYPANPVRGRLYFNPGVPEARRFVENAMLDVVERYDVDAVHFDDFFYPYPAKGEDFPDDATFAAHGEGFVDKNAWRRGNVDLMIKEMHQRIHELKPWVQFGVSPFGIWRNATADPLGSATSGNQSYAANHADTKRWVEEGWLDYIVPQLYWTIGFAKADYAALVPWWSTVIEGTGVRLYIGQAAYRTGSTGSWGDAGELSAHLALNRNHPQVSGDVYFSAKDVRADRIGAITRVAAEHYAAPALVPQTGQPTAATRMPPTVTKARADPDSGAVRIGWEEPANLRSGADQVRSYAVYRFDGDAMPGRCGFADATHLIGTTGERDFVDSTAAAGHQYTYAVTAVDRRGGESDAGTLSTAGRVAVSSTSTR